MSKWNDEFLNRMRMEGDPFADAAAASLFQHENQSGIFRDLQKMATNDTLVPEDFPDELKDYFEKTSHTEFSDYDLECFETASDIFNRFGYLMVSILFFKSLPTGYMCPWPSHVLSTTKLLEDQAARRVFETAQYLFEVMEHGWFLPDGKGIRAIQKVRLMHAGMRVMILTRVKPPWNVNQMGKPINQEDLVLTLQLFSLAIIKGLYQMGIKLTDDEQEKFFHTWKVIGRLMGINRELEPENVADGWDLQNKIISRLRFLPNEDGDDLAKALIDVIHDRSGEFLSHRSLEKISIYFLHEYPDAYKYLGYHKPNLSERLFDTLILWFLRLRIWHYLFHKDHTKDKQIGWIGRKVLNLIHNRLGLKHHHDQDPKTDLMEHLSKAMLNKMTLEAKLSDNKHFNVHEKLVAEWQLGGFKFDAAGEVE